MKNFIDIAEYKTNLCKYNTAQFLKKHRLYEMYDKFLQIILVQCFQYICCFKKLWFDFLLEDYYDYMDNNCFSLELVNHIILKRAKQKLRGKECQNLKSVFDYLNFNSSTILEEFCLSTGVILMDYQGKIRRLTNTLLEEMNESAKDCKFITKHVLIAKIHRLRFELKDLKEKDQKKLCF